ncbi:acetyl-CoA carboxylase biotin carboxyl carrier protein subunit, partial [Actinorugispora endophytica]
PDQPPTTHTRWIETEFDNRIEPYQGIVETTEEAPRQKVTVEVDGRRVEVTLPAGLGTAPDPAPGTRKTARRGDSRTKTPPAGGDALTSPMQGTIVKVTAENGRQVTEGDTVVVIEAMKMEQPLTAHKTGTVTGLSVGAGETVGSGTVICEIRSA